ncbi:MAG: hypothetical protein KDA65_01970 [Planctomycetaceae bacterium]|nr:hypothetical protein [Planctomycetaceae bacterium]
MVSDSRSGMSFQTMAIFIVVVVVLLFILLLVIFNLIELRDANAQLLTDKGTLNKTLNETKDQLTALTGERDALSAEKQKLSEQLKTEGESAEKHMTDGKAEIEKLTGEKEELSTNLATANKAKEDLQAQIEGLNAVVEKQKAANAEALKQEQQKLEMANAIQTALKKEAEALQKELENQRVEQEKALKLAAEAEQKIVEELNLAKTSLQQNTKQIMDFKSSLAQAEESKAKWLEEIKNVVEREEKLKTQLSQMIKEHDQLLVEKAKVESQLEEARKSPPAPAKEELQKLIAAEIKAGNTGMAGELQKIAATLQSLQKQMQEVQTSLKATSKEAEPEEAASK